MTRVRPINRPMYPLADVARLVDPTGLMSRSDVATALGVSRKRFYRMRASERLTAAEADEIALHLGRMPWEIWRSFDEWVPSEFECREAERLARRSARDARRRLVSADA